MEPKNYFKVFCTYLIVIHYYQASKNKDSYINLLNHLAFASTALPNIFSRTSAYFFANTSLFSAMGWPSQLILSNFTNNSLVRKQCSTAIRRNGIVGLECCRSEALGVLWGFMHESFQQFCFCCPKCPPNIFQKNQHHKTKIHA